MLDLITSILVLLIVAIGLGEIFNAFSMPEVVGAIIAGIILGPALLGLVVPSRELEAISVLALFFIILQIGIEVSSDVFSKNVKYIAIFAVSSFIVPFLVMSLGSLYIFHLPYLISVSLSLSVSIPSISITSVLLVKSGLVKIEDGLRLLGGVALSDVIGFIIFVSFHRPAYLIAIDFASLIAFTIVLYYLDMYLTSRSEKLIRWFGKSRSARKEGVIFALVIVMGLAVSSLFEVIGITFVLGAFFSGMIIHKKTVGPYVSGILSRTFQRINSSFFVPIYFSISGLSVSMIPLSLYTYLIFLMAISATVGGFAAYEFSKQHMNKISPSATLGIFGGRGAVGIIIASLALSDGFIDNTYYSVAIFATVIMAIAFTLVFERAMKKSGIKMQNDASIEQSEIINL